MQDIVKSFTKEKDESWTHSMIKKKLELDLKSYVEIGENYGEKEKRNNYSQLGC